MFGTHDQVKVCEIFWHPGTREWAVSARPTDEDGTPGTWGGVDSLAEDQLAEGLNIARDIMTGEMERQRRQLERGR